MWNVTKFASRRLSNTLLISKQLYPVLSQNLLTCSSIHSSSSYGYRQCQYNKYRVVSVRNYAAPGGGGSGRRIPEPKFTWTNFFITMTAGSILVAITMYMKNKEQQEREISRRRQLGKAKIGGPWELMNMNGKGQTSADFHGRWVLIYFGFTHCPDICPDEIEKMCQVADILDENPTTPGIKPLFFTVDIERDSVEAVKKYCEEFSPKLLGFTGTKEQVANVCKTFRVYHSEGPRDVDNDYIVDHTVIMYLVDPDGQFIDYYGQNRTASEIATAIEMEMFKYERGKRKKLW